MTFENSKRKIKESYYNDSKSIAIAKYPQLVRVFAIVDAAVDYASENKFNVRSTARFISKVEYKVFKKLFSDENLKELKKKAPSKGRPLDIEEIEIKP